MKLRKFLVVLAVLCACVFTASAQAGIEFGYLNSRYSTEIAGKTKSGAPLNGFYVGVSDEVRIIAGLGFHIGLNYSYVTDKSAESLIHDFKMNGAEKDHYLNVPIRLRYAFNVIPKVLKLQVYAGPVLSLGLSHTYTYDIKTEVAGLSLKGKLKYNYYTGTFKSDTISEKDLEALKEKVPNGGVYNRFDVGLGGGVGVELFNFLEVKAGYDWGLLNRYKGTAADLAECRRNNFNITVGLRF